MSKYQSYVICTTPRSGSTLLCKLLAATGKSGNPDSWFHAPSIANWTNFHLDASPEHFATKREALAAVFQAAREHGTQNTGIFGLRLQRERVGFLMQQLAILYPAIPNESGRIEAAFGKTLFIYLSRDDKLDQAISYVKATQSGLWHRAADGSELERLSTPQELLYDAGRISQCLEKVATENAAWERWFSHEGIMPLRVRYEALAENPTGILVQIFEALGLDFDDSCNVQPAVAKLADETNRSWKQRYLLESE